MVAKVAKRIYIIKFPLFAIDCSSPLFSFSTNRIGGLKYRLEESQSRTDEGQDGKTSARCLP